jgi:hypothetical protein
MPNKASARKGSPAASKEHVANLAQRVDALMKRIPKGTARRVGGRIGMAAGGIPGAAMGSVIGQGIAAITGYGDYKVRANSLNVVGTSVDTVPRFVNSDHAVRMTHREFVGDLVVPDNPTGFNNTTYDINPSNNKLFPWLSRMATQYQQYRVHGMIVEYKSMSSDYAASGPLGTVMIASNYNVNDKPFDTKVALENSEFAVSSKPSRSIIHAIECDPALGAANRYYYVRDLGASSNGVSDNRLYDLAKVQVATSGLPGTAGATMGEIWVSYDIEFTKPVLSSTSDGPSGLKMGLAAVSSPTLSSPSIEGGRVGTITYSTDVPLPITDNTTQSLFRCATGNLDVAGDTFMDSRTTTMDINGNLRVYRNGMYTVRYVARCVFTSATMHYSADTSSGVAPTLLSIGSANSLLRYADVSVRHFFRTGAGVLSVDIDAGIATVSFIVSGIPDDGTSDNYVSVLAPVQASGLNAATRCTPIRSNIDVDWIEFKQTLMEP